MTDAAPTKDGAIRAARRLAPMVTHTPVLRSSVLDALCEAQILLKLEALQIGGSFKYRGALNKMLQFSPAKVHDVVAYSSGNHAIAVASAAARLGIRATLVMPYDAPLIKVTRVTAAGGRIEYYDREHDDRVAKSRALAERLCAEIIPSFDDCDIIEGQASAVLELIQDARSQGAELDDILVPCGGGGLMAGAVLAADACSANARLHAVEPTGFDDMARSLRSRRRETNLVRTGSICDALMIAQPGEITFPVIARRTQSGLTVTDDEVRRAINFAFRELKVVLEPGGAVALAAVLSKRLDCRTRTVGLVLSGGNVDDRLFASIVSGTDHAEHTYQGAISA